jgi:hypothetical protein
VPIERLRLPAEDNHVIDDEAAATLRSSILATNRKTRSQRARADLCVNAHVVA